MRLPIQSRPVVRTTLGQEPVARRGNTGDAVSPSVGSDPKEACFRSCMAGGGSQPTMSAKIAYCQKSCGMS